MLSLIKSAAKKNRPRAGIVLNEQGVTVAVVRRRGGEKPVLEHFESIAANEGESLDHTVAHVVHKLHLAQSLVSSVVAPDDYQLVQVEAPEVQPAEMRAAVRWRLRDVINFHIDDAVVDVFEIPDQSRRTQTKMMFAVAARSAAVQRLATAIAPRARGFDSIDIPELCLRNVSALLPQDQKGVAFLLLTQRAALLVLTRQGALYLVRRIDYARRFDLGSDGAPGIDAEMLALELQRSLDYYESHFDQTAIGDLVIAPNNAAAQKLATELKNESSLRIECLSLEGVLEGAEKIAENLSVEGLLALGAALRVESTEL